MRRCEQGEGEDSWSRRFTQKPFSARALAAKVREALDQG